MEHDLTRGNVLKTIAVFALPYMLSYFLQMLYGCLLYTSPSPRDCS